jgi:hypothetical protein
MRLLSGEIHEGDRIVVDVEDEAFVFRVDPS